MRHIVASSKEMRDILQAQGLDRFHIDDVVGTKTRHGMLHDLARKDCETILIGPTPEEDIVFANKEVVEGEKYRKSSYNWRHHRDLKVSKRFKDQQSKRG